MGILWTVYPLIDEMKKWLDSEGVTYPNSGSRFPTGSEVKEALAQMNGVKIIITDNGLGAFWQAWIESESSPKELWTNLNISKYSGDGELQEIWFERGHDSLIKLVLKNICQKCGPLVLIPDTGDLPEVVNA